MRLDNFVVLNMNIEILNFLFLNVFVFFELFGNGEIGIDVLLRIEVYIVVSGEVFCSFF